MFHGISHRFLFQLGLSIYYLEINSKQQIVRIYAGIDIYHENILKTWRMGDLHKHFIKHSGERLKIQSC